MSHISDLYQKANTRAISMARNIPELATISKDDAMLLVFIEARDIADYLEHLASGNLTVLKNKAFELLESALDLVYEKEPTKVKALYQHLVETEVIADLKTQESGEIDSAVLDVIFRTAAVDGPTVLASHDEIRVKVMVQHGLVKNKEQIRRSLHRLAKLDIFEYTPGKKGLVGKAASSRIKLSLSKAPLGKGLATHVDLDFKPGVEEAVRDWRKQAQKLRYEVTTQFHQQFSHLLEV